MRFHRSEFNGSFNGVDHDPANLVGGGGATIKREGVSFSIFGKD